MVLDIKTLMLLNFVINFVNAGVLIIVWRQYRKHYAGLVFFLFDMILQTVGFALSLLRGVLPPIISIVLANTMLMAGALLVLIGLEKFFNFKKKHIHNYILLVLFAATLYWFSLIQPELASREIAISTVILIFNVQSCRLLFHCIPNDYRRKALFTGLVLLAYNLLSIIRIAILAAMPLPPNDFFKAGLFDATVIAAYLILSVLFTMSIIMLVSRRLLMEIQNEKEKYGATFNSSPYAIILTRMSDGTIFEVNEGFTKITGYKSEDVVGRTSIEMNLWAKKSDRERIVSELSKGNEVNELEMHFIGKRGNQITALVSSKVFFANRERCIITSVSDITEMTRIRQELQELAMHDVLTGLPNRKLFYDRFEVAKANAQREKAKLAIVSLDIDLLKAANDIYGHDAGDRILIEVSRRLSKTLRKVDTVARFGGDEFALLLWRTKQTQDILNVITKMQSLIAKPILVGEQAIDITLSIGIAIYPKDGTDINELLKKSDQAMYYVKEHGRNNYQFYEGTD